MSGADGAPPYLPLGAVHQIGQCALVAATSDEIVLAEILLSEWDPLDARDIDLMPEHEYRYEAARVLTLLRDGVDRARLTDHLAAARLALTSHNDASSDQTAAKAIIDWWPANAGT